MREFECSQPITLAVTLPAGSLDVVAEPRDTATVDVQSYDAGQDADDRTIVELRGDTLVVELPHGSWRRWRASRIQVRVRVPEDTRLRLKLASADARCEGRYGASSASSASGDVGIEHVAGDLSVDAASGDVRLGRVDGNLSVDTASGDLVLAEAGSSARVRTASGDVRLESVHRGETSVGTASGDVKIGVAAGTGVWLDLSTASGTTRSDLDMGADGPSNRTPDLTLRIRTASGDIQLRRVAAITAKMD
jgi:DUF4097 and DUF4098 domain-containing protein YvlB